MKINLLLPAIILLSACNSVPGEEKKVPVSSPSASKVLKREWWKEAIICQINLPDFKKADGTKGGVADIPARLDYWQAMGANALWLQWDSTRNSLEQKEALSRLQTMLAARNMELVVNERFQPNAAIPGWLPVGTAASQDSQLLSMEAKGKKTDWLLYKQYLTDCDRQMGEGGWRHIRLASGQNNGYPEAESAEFRDAWTKMRQTMLFTLRATPTLSSGYELGGSPEAGQAADSNSALSYARRIIRLRRNNLLLVYGSFKEIDPTNDQVFAYTRTLGNERWLILLNLSSITKPFEVPPALAYKSAEKIMGNYERDDKAYERTWLLLPYFAGIYRLK